MKRLKEIREKVENIRNKLTVDVSWDIKIWASDYAQTCDYLLDRVAELEKNIKQISSILHCPGDCPPPEEQDHWEVRQAKLLIHRITELEKTCTELNEKYGNLQKQSVAMGIKKAKAESKIELIEAARDMWMETAYKYSKQAQKAEKELKDWTEATEGE